MTHFQKNLLLILFLSISQVIYSQKMHSIEIGLRDNSYWGNDVKINLSASYKENNKWNTLYDIDTTIQVGYNSPYRQIFLRHYVKESELSINLSINGKYYSSLVLKDPNRNIKVSFYCIGCLLIGEEETFPKLSPTIVSEIEEIKNKDIPKLKNRANNR